MRQRRLVAARLLLLGFGVAVVALGWIGRQQAAPLQAVSPAIPAATPAAGAPGATFDDQLAAIARQVPGFAGMFRDPDTGTLHIYLKDPTYQAAAEQALADAFGPGLLAGGRVQILYPEYDFLELKQWYDQLGNLVWGIPGVSATDIDEAANRIRIWAGTVEARAAVEAAVQQAGVPAGAVIIETPEHPLSEAEPLAGCQLAERPPGEAVSAPVGLVLSADAVAAGARLTLTVSGVAEPERITRGVDSYLECWDGAGWSPRYLLLTGADGTDRPPRAVLYSGFVVVESLGLGGPGPEPIQLPESLEPGWYRIRKQVSITTEGGSESRELWALIQVTR